MIRYFVLLINVLGAMFFSLFMQQDIDVKMEVPDQVKAGEDFSVVLTISKGSLESFSRFQQDLPYGLSATRIVTANADFTFENQRVRLIWLKLPKEQSLDVSYRITVDERLKGSFTLGAEFSYIDNNERKSITVKSPQPISITPSPLLSADQLIDINDFQKYALSEIEKEKIAGKLTCIRKTPVQTGREIMVELLLNKGNLNKFAKIEEFIPEGFLAGEVDSKNGIFTFEKNTIRILWMNLPEEQEFTVRYRLFPDKNKTLEELRISGTFSYIHGNQTKTLEITEKKPDLATANGEPAETMISFIPEPEERTVIKTDIVKETEQIIMPDLTEHEVMPQPELPLGNDTFILKPESGVYFRVQLAAGHKPVDIPAYFTRLSVDENVKMEFHEGWRKYSLGSFHEYKEARDSRNIVWNKTPIKDAFVSAYNSGTRISVQEALMITSQKWYR